ncbi:MAG: O-antigen ligase family protein [Actinomycetota bacterium]
MAVRKRDAATLLPGAAGSVGVGLLASQSPLAAGGAFALTGLFLLPWVGLFLLMTTLSMIQAEAYGPLAGVELLGFDFSPAHFVLIPFAIRAYLTTKPDLRLRWGKPEWFLVAFALIQPFITFRKAPAFSQSLGALGLTALGILAYLAVYAAVCTPRRFLSAARIFLWLILLNAVYGILAELSHLALGTRIGVSTQSAYGSGVYGLSFEHDIFASTCAVGAIAFYVLWRERNPIMSHRLSGVAFWLCGAASLLGLARGAWRGFGLVFLAMMVLPRGGARRVRGLERVGTTVILLSIVVLGGMYVLSSQSSTFEAIQQKAEDLINVETGTGQARLQETAVALTDWRTSKLFGLGTGTYNQRHPQKEKTNYIGNIYLRALYETGLVGAFLLIAFLALVFWPNRSLLYASGDVPAVARALSYGGAVVTVAYAATDATLFIWPWIMFGLIRASRVLVDRQYRSAAAVRAAPAAPATVASGASVSGNGHGAVPVLDRPGAFGASR